jgi:hypothetical protein
MPRKALDDMTPDELVKSLGYRLAAVRREAGVALRNAEILDRYGWTVYPGCRESAGELAQRAMDTVERVAAAVRGAG